MQCPTNQRTGKPVDTITLKALLAVPLTEVQSTSYGFCPDPACPTVYFSTDATQCFSEGAVREKVYQKHPADEDVFVCYCFRHTIKSIHTEIRQTGQSTVVAAITAGIQAGQCACDIRNPQGACCLGNVQKIVQHLQTELEAARTDAAQR
jgi:hypothetical protein